MKTQRRKTVCSIGSKKLEMGKTCEVISVCGCLLFTSVPTRIESFLGSSVWFFTPEPKETSVSLAGFQMNMLLRGLRAYDGKRFRLYSELFFSFLPFILNVKALHTTVAP